MSFYIVQVQAVERECGEGGMNEFPHVYDLVGQ